MTLTLERIQMALPGRPARFYAQIGSTNDAALAWLDEGAPTGAIVVADEQTKGRGRLGRGWYAPPGTALMVSIVLRPQREDAARATMLGTVAVCEVLNELGAPGVGIKWANDVRLNNLKVAGILAEAVWRGNDLHGIVLGIGLNVRIDFGDTELETTATSLETALGKPVDRLDALVRLLRRADDWSARLGSPELYAAWRRRLLTVGQVVTVTRGDETLRGLAEDVDSQGALLVRTADGMRHRVIAGEVAPNRE